MSIYSNFTINDVLLNRESLQKKNKYSCPICFEYFYKKSVYQCRSGHYACKECWEKSLENKKECMICRTEVKSFKHLSRCLIIEQNFGKKQCYCIYSFYLDYFIDDANQENDHEKNDDYDDENENEDGNEDDENENEDENEDEEEDEDEDEDEEEDEDEDENELENEDENEQGKLMKDEDEGCNEIINVDQLDAHIENCKFKFVKCSNIGCEFVSRLNSLEEHENQCDFKLVICKYCGCDDIIQMELENHDCECSKFPIDCPQNCSIIIERDQIKSHTKNDCDNSTIPCIYYEFGCKVETKRSNLQNHLNNVNHQIFMGPLIDKLSSTLSTLSTLSESKKTQDELVKKIEQSEKAQEKLHQEIVQLKNNNDNLLSFINKMDGTYSPTYKNKWIISNPSRYYVTSQPFNFENQQFHLLFKKDFENTASIEPKTNGSFNFKYIFTLVNILDKSKSIKFKGPNLNLNKINYSILGLHAIQDKKNGWLDTNNKLTIKIFIKKLINNPPLES
ncbi:hypothetical protein ACTFIZ_011953 [Dictyostelium cf. discoideum]